jgi:type III secretion protein R
VKRLLWLAALLPCSPALAARTGGAATFSEVSFAGHPVSMMATLAVMALLPFAILMLTSFSKIAVVLSLTRSAMGTQQAPPTIVLTGLAAVLSGHIMAPVVERMYDAGEAAYREAGSGAQMISAAGQVAQPLREFLVKHATAEEIARFVDMSRELRPVEEAGLVSEDDLAVIVPAFVITELKEAFQIGFLVFLPFLVLDMVIANVLLALGMQSLSPSQVSLPFKILLFVAVDGWSLLARGLILGYR